MTKEQKTTFYIFTLAATLIVWKIWVLYFSSRLYGYIVPPGADPLNHLEIIQGVLNGHWNAAYPPLFHVLIALASWVFSADPLTILTNFSPLLVLLPPVAVYIFLSKNFSRLAGIIGFAFTILASNYGLVAYGDGNYPNILAAGFFMPIAFSYVVSAFKGEAKKNIFFALVFILLVILTHHLTTMLFLIIFIVYLIVLVVWNKYESIVPRLNKVAIALVACLIIAFAVIALTSLKDVFINMLINLRSSGSVLLTSQFSKIPSLAECSQMLGEFPFYLGLGALVYLTVMLSRPKDQVNKPGIILILVWSFMIFLFSQSSFVGLPSRIAREMGIPLLLAIGIFISDILKSLKHQSSKVIVMGIFALLVSGSLVQINAGAYQSPDFFSKMVLFWPGDKEKTDFIKDSFSQDDKIFSNFSSPYLKYFGEEKIEVTNSPGENDKEILKKIKEKKCNYLMIINSSKANPYPENVVTDNAVKKRLKTFADKNDLDVFHVFSDGSIIYTVDQSLISGKKSLL